MPLTLDEQQALVRRCWELYPEFMADPHWNLHRQYGWTPKHLR